LLAFHGQKFFQCWLAGKFLLRPAIKSTGIRPVFPKVFRDISWGRYEIELIRGIEGIAVSYRTGEA
jgi:hypothetical protein